MHISDLVSLYATLVEKILQDEPIPSGEEGYYFAMAHTVPVWETMQLIADGLYERRLVTEPKVQIWPSDAKAAEFLGFPPQYVRAMGTNSAPVVPFKAHKLGWKPKWDEKMFLASVDDEIQAVLELDKHSATIFNTLLNSSSK